MPRPLTENSTTLARGRPREAVGGNFVSSLGVFIYFLICALFIINCPGVVLPCLFLYVFS